jgi:hypothetical protein
MEEGRVMMDMNKGGAAAGKESVSKGKFNTELDRSRTQLHYDNME